MTKTIKAQAKIFAASSQIFRQVWCASGRTHAELIADPDRRNIFIAQRYVSHLIIQAREHRSCSFFVYSMQYFLIAHNFQNRDGPLGTTIVVCF